MRLKDMVILLTDGETELSRQIAARFQEEGARVTVRTEEARGAPFDPAAARAFVDALVRREGRLDVLLCNVCTADPMTLEGASDEQMWNALSRVAGSAFFFTQAAARHMRKGGGGKILYLGSIHSEKPAGSAVGFSAAMGAVEMLCREVALDLAAYPVQSAFVQAGALEGDDARFESALTPLYDHFTQKIPGRRPVNPEEIVELLVFLATPECGALNGATLRADRGFMLHYLPRGTYEREGVDTGD